MAVIVTGGTGFIGKHLAEALAVSGRDVRCLARKPGSVDFNSRVGYTHADFSRSDLGVADEVFAGVDVVYHLAGATRAPSEAAFREANVGVTERLLNRIAQVGIKPRFVYVSSQAAAGPSPEASRVLCETDAPAPVEDYGRSKLAAEAVVRSRGPTLPVTIVRPVAVYGPGDRDFLSIFRLAKRGIAVFPGIRDAIVNTIFVSDLVEGLIAAASSDTAIGKTYFMGHRQSDSWRAIYRVAADAMGVREMREINIPIGVIRLGGVAGTVVGRITGRTPLLNNSKAALAAPRYWTCSSAMAEADLGFAPGTSLHHGMRATYDWYLRHRWL